MKKLKKALFGTVALSCMSVPVGVIAQQNDASEIFMPEEIVVTATRRATSLQDTPLSLTAVIGEQMEMLSAIDFVDFVGSIPGISYTSIGATGSQTGERDVSLRGLAATSGEATVGFYIDEAPLPFTEPKIFDVNRVEVLRGPQGTLFGASSMGGTIRVITNSPNLSEFEGKVDLTYSNTKYGGDNNQVNLMLNAPVIKDKLAVRLVGLSGHEEGYVDNIYAPTAEKNFNDEDAVGGRISVLFKPTENVSIKPSVFYQKVRLENDGRFGVDLPKLQTEALLPTPTAEKISLSSLEIAVDLDFGTIISNTSYLDYDRDGDFDTSGAITGALGLPSNAPSEAMHDEYEVQSFTQEVRLASNSYNKFKWLVGAFYSNRDETWIQDYSPDGLNDFLVDLSGSGFPFGDNLFSKTEEGTTRQVAVFADITYDLTDRLSLEAGTRWFDYKIKTHRLADGLFNGGPEDVRRKTTDNGFTSLIKASFEATEDFMVYASVSQGYRPGFATGVPPNPPCVSSPVPPGQGIREIGPDKLLAFELGEKATFSDGRVTVNGAVYYNEWTDVQQSVELACGFSVSDNGGKASSRGGELEISARPIQGLSLRMAASYVDAQLDSDVPTLGGSKGDRLVLTNDWQVYLDGTYQFPVSENTNAYIHADFTYLGDMDFTYPGGANGIPALDRRDGYYQIGLRAGVMVGDSLEVALLATNITNQMANLGSNSFFNPVTQYTIRPRTLGLNVKKDF